MSFAQSNIPEKDKTSIFTSAGFKNRLGTWQSKCSFGAIGLYQDLNGDKRPDAIVKDGGTACYPKIGVGFYIVTQQVNKSWHTIFHSAGEAKLLKTKGVNGWPDIEVIDLTKCHGVFRWDGKNYVKQRHQYNGKECIAPVTAHTQNEEKKTSTTRAEEKKSNSNKVETKNPKPVKKALPINDPDELEQSIEEEAEKVQESTAIQPIVETKPKVAQPSENDLKMYKAFEGFE